MKTDNQKVDRILSDIRFVYIVFYMAYISIVSVIPVRLVFDGNPINSLVYSLLAGFGVVFLLVDFFYHRTLFKSKNCGLLILYIIALMISIVSNAQYGIVDNIKTLAWTCIQLFIFSAIDTDLPSEKHFKHLQIITEILGAIWLYWSVWSLLLFLQQYHQTLQFDDIVNVTEMGFCQGRLFGIFTDPNYASLVSFAAVAFAVLNLNLRKCSMLSKVYHYIQIVVQICYIVLSGSRTVRLSIAVAAAVLGALLVWRFVENRKKNLFVCICSVVLVAGIAIVGVFQVCKISETILSYAPSVYNTLLSKTSFPVNNPSESEETAVPSESGESVAPSVEHNDITHVDMVRPDVSESNDISNNRFKIWKDYLKVYTSAPVFGVSPRNSMEYTMDHFDDLFVIDRQYSIHNTYLALLVCTGTVGAILMYGWLILKAWDILGYLIRRRNTRDQYYRPVLILTSVLIVDAVAALPLYFIFFNNMIIDLIFWVTLGYVTGFIHMSEPERYEMTLPYRMTDKLLAKLRLPRK